MSKGLEALERLTEIHNYDDVKECYDIIEKELKALEVIKKKKKIIQNHFAGIDIIVQSLTQEELDSFKEELL